MASRKFKENWITTPLPLAAGPGILPVPPEPEPGQRVTSLQGAVEAARAESPLTTIGDSALESAEAVAAAAGVALAAIRDSALGSAQSAAAAAGSALAATRNTAVGSVTAAASAANSVLSAARHSAAGSALASATGTALTATGIATAGSALAAVSQAAASRATALAGSALAAALEPIPSPVALYKRASFIIRFMLLWTVRELWRTLLSTVFTVAPRSVKSARKLREFVERLGGMWITLARLASLREDLLGAQFCRELARTRDLSPPVPIEIIRNQVDQELHKVGKTFSEVFSDFDPQPLLVRSFGQVHRAHLRESGREVSVRIRAADAKERSATDWRYMRIMLFVIKQLDLEPHLYWDDLMFEVKKANDDLLDFRAEVAELRKMRQRLRARRIYVPMLFRRYCTEQMLVIEYIDGVTLQDVQQVAAYEPERLADWLHENKIRPRRVWRRLFNAHNEMLFEHNMFYTELLPSNIRLLRDNRMAFVSMGTIGTLDANLQGRYRRLYRAFIQGDYTKACDTYMMMGPPLPYLDSTDMKQAVIRALRKWESRTHVKQAPYREKSLDAAVASLARCATKYCFPTVWNLARLQSAERILNKSLDFLDPTRSGLKAIKGYETASQIRSIKQAATKRIRKRVDNFTDVAQLNMQLLENLEHDGDYLRRRLQNVQAKLSKVSEIGGRLLMMAAKVALVALAVQVFIYFKQGYNTQIPLADRGTVGRVFELLRPRSRMAWVALLLILFYFRRLLVNVARQMFVKEVRPGDVL